MELGLVLGLQRSVASTEPCHVLGSTPSRCIRTRSWRDFLAEGMSLCLGSRCSIWGRLWDGSSYLWSWLPFLASFLPSFLSSRKVMGMVLSLSLSPSQGEKTEVIAILQLASGKGDEHYHTRLLPKRREQEVMTIPHLCFWKWDKDEHGHTSPEVKWS